MAKNDRTLYGVRESDLPRAYRKHGETIDGQLTHHWWTSDGDWAGHEDAKPEEIRHEISGHLKKIASLEAAAQAIESEDEMLAPEVRAQELWEAAREGEYRVKSWDDVERNIRDEYRRIAAYLIAREG